MRFLRHVLAWLRRDGLDDQLRDELAQHRASTVERLLADGLSEEDARRQAAVIVGNPLRLRERSRAIWGFPGIESIAQDVRYGLRRLRRSPLFTLTTVATLGLTIGATSALFAVANAVVWRPLAFPHSDRIVSISDARHTDFGRMDEPTGYIAMASHLPSFESFALYDSVSAGLTGDKEPERVRGALISAGFFDVMRVQPVLGRSFVAPEMRQGGPPAIIVSESLWTRALGRDPDALGRIIKLDDHSYAVVGVMPTGFGFPTVAPTLLARDSRQAFPAGTEFWLPLSPRSVKGGGVFFAGLIGRLRPGVSVQTARNDLLRLRVAHARELPTVARESDIRVMPLHERLYGDFRTPVMLLLGAVVCVLLIGCANVANLLLARGAARRQELAVRAALGASRGRVVRQLMIESVLLAVLGGIPALAILYGGVRAFRKFGPTTLTSIPGIAVDARVSGCLVGITIAVGLLFGFVPALSQSLEDPRARLEDGRRTLTVAHGGLRRALVVFEMAAAVVVVVGASLLVKSLVRFETIDMGFHADTVLSASLTLPRSRYADPQARSVFFDDLLARVRALPGVESAAFPAGANALSLTTQWSGSGSKGSAAEPSEIGVWEGVGSANFRTYGIPILDGRECRDREPVGARAAVINTRMARLAFGGRPTVGQTLNLGGQGTFTVIGVAADARNLTTNAIPLPMVFACVDPGDPGFGGEIALRPRTGTDPASLASALRKTVASVDPELPVANIETVRQLLDQAGASRHFDALLFGAFAALAFTLAIFGLYAVTAYLVAQRTREFGVRMALGAARGSVVRLVLRQALGPALSGLALGLIAAATLTRLLHGMLFEVSTLDASVFGAVAIILAGISAGAAAVPAFRAVTIDPVAALRVE